VVTVVTQLMRLDFVCNHSRNRSGKHQLRARDPQREAAPKITGQGVPRG